MAGRRKLETIEDYQRALRNKYGIGNGKSYKPWFRPQDLPSQGIRSSILGRKTGRQHHTASLIESQLFYILDFHPNVVDIREQFPILPLNYSQKIAKFLEVDHPSINKTNSPFIMTTDFLVTVMSHGLRSYIAISVKPENKLEDQRVREKQDIERVCWQLLGVPFKIFFGNEKTEIESNNISWATAPFREQAKHFCDDEIYLALKCLDAGIFFVSDICDRFTKLNIVPHEQALTLLRYLIAERLIGVDPPLAG